MLVSPGVHESGSTGREADDLRERYDDIGATPVGVGHAPIVASVTDVQVVVNGPQRARNESLARST